ncbi:MAG: hypothetical protein HKN72_14475 [Gemmatimonadetes bacterium]|nr:hypothetical protein [Gemmatimonadota bacterium]
MQRRPSPRRVYSSTGLRADGARGVLVGCVLASGLLAGIAASDLAAQTVVPVHEEPRHRLVHESAALQVLDIGFQPGDTTLFHRHDRPIAYVEIDATVVNQQRLGGPWGRVVGTRAPPRRAPGRVSWNEGYADVPLEHRVTAIGPGPFRLIGVVSLGFGDESGRTGPLGPFEAAHDSSRYFSQVRVEMDAGQAVEWPPTDAPVVMVLASAGELSVESEQPAPDVAAHLVGAGAFSVLAPGTSLRIRNLGSGPVALSFVEVR